MSQNAKIDSKSIALRFVEAMGSGDVEAAASLVAEGLVNHAAIPEAQGREGLRTIARKIRKAFPDAAWKLEDIIVEGDRAVCRLTFTGTNTGPVEFVRMPHAATGRSVRFEQIHIFRVENGLVVESWACRDDIALMRQLGVLDTKAAA